MMAAVKNAIPANYDNLCRKFHCFQRGETELYLIACNALFEAINSGILVPSADANNTVGKDLIEAVYLIQDVINSCDESRYGEAMAAICEVSHD